jgi:hypothetical protein
MHHLPRSHKYGFLVWLVPFAVSVVLYPLVPTRKA